jgi:hypothetical protein
MGDDSRSLIAYHAEVNETETEMSRSLGQGSGDRTMGFGSDWVFGQQKNWDWSSARIQIYILARQIRVFPRQVSRG